MTGLEARERPSPDVTLLQGGYSRNNGRETAMAFSKMPRREPRFIWLFLGKVVLLAVTIIVVYAIYAYLHAFHLDWLGRSYAKLLPLTNALYALVETYLPDDVKYKIRGAITDDLGQRSIFLLLLTATVELTLYTLFKFMKYLMLGARRAA
jgi:hypothetical protein